MLPSTTGTSNVRRAPGSASNGTDVVSVTRRPPAGPSPGRRSRASRDRRHRSAERRPQAARDADAHGPTESTTASTPDAASAAATTATWKPSTKPQSTARAWPAGHALADALRLRRLRPSTGGVRCGTLSVAAARRGRRRDGRRRRFRVAILRRRRLAVVVYVEPRSLEDDPDRRKHAAHRRPAPLAALDRPADAVRHLELMVRASCTDTRTAA